MRSGNSLSKMAREDHQRYLAELSKRKIVHDRTMNVGETVQIECGCSKYHITRCERCFTVEEIYDFPVEAGESSISYKIKNNGKVEVDGYSSGYSTIYQTPLSYLPRPIKKALVLFTPEKIRRNFIRKLNEERKESEIQKEYKNREKQRKK